MTTPGFRQEQYELERLRELYKLDENYSDYEKIGAHVIANNGSNWFSDFTIDKGSNDGDESRLQCPGRQRPCGYCNRSRP